MKPVAFPEANARLGPPVDLAESQCLTVPAHITRAAGGSLDGSRLVVVAWQPDVAERQRLAAGGLVYLSCIGGLPPHFLTTDFQEAIKPG